MIFLLVQVKIRLVFACGALIHKITIFIPWSCRTSGMLILSLNASQAAADGVVTLGTLETGVSVSRRPLARRASLMTNHLCGVFFCLCSRRPC